MLFISLYKMNKFGKNKKKSSFKKSLHIHTFMLNNFIHSCTSTIIISLEKNLFFFPSIVKLNSIFKSGNQFHLLYNNMLKSKKKVRIAF